MKQRARGKARNELELQSEAAEALCNMPRSDRATSSTLYNSMRSGAECPR